jgi:predicted enzyme related to lactoylglutathione lyase
MANATKTKAPKAAKTTAKTTAKTATIEKSALASKIAYAMLYVPDMAKAIEFYKMIGLEAGMESPEWTEFNAGIKFALHGMCSESKTADYKAKNTGLCFGVANIDATYAAFKTLGVKLNGEAHQVCEDGYAFEFQDPFGNTLSAYGPKA